MMRGYAWSLLIVLINVTQSHEQYNNTKSILTSLYQDSKLNLMPQVVNEHPASLEKRSNTACYIVSLSQKTQHVLICKR